MGQNQKPEITCAKCGHSGNDYIILPKGLLANGEPMHFECSCAHCGAFLQFLSKSDKYGSKENKREIWHATKGHCCYCGSALNPFEPGMWHTEHIVARKKGGSDETENLFPSCKHCNTQKGTKSVEEYRQYMADIKKAPKWIFHYEVIWYTSLGDNLSVMF